MMAPNTRIAGKRTVTDWQTLRPILAGGGNSVAWKHAFEDFYYERLKARYFKPIQTLESAADDRNGEGFSIVAIYCTLIEFVASTLEGKTYRYKRRGDPPLGRFEYSNSGDMFDRFLIRYVPFCNMFPDVVAAKDFYKNVRCGLLHEARTKGGWLIKFNSTATKAIDIETKIVYRNKMKEAFHQFVQWYGEQLPQCPDLQEGFIRKFDSLCAD
jgi:hypothetical protein